MERHQTFFFGQHSRSSSRHGRSYRTLLILKKVTALICKVEGHQTAPKYCPPQGIVGLVSRVSCRGTSIFFRCCRSSTGHGRSSKFMQRNIKQFAVCIALIAISVAVICSHQCPVSALHCRSSRPLLSKIQHIEPPWHEECLSRDIIDKIQSNTIINAKCEIENANFQTAVGSQNFYT